METHVLLLFVSCQILLQLPDLLNQKSGETHSPETFHSHRPASSACLVVSLLQPSSIACRCYLCRWVLLHAVLARGTYYFSVSLISSPGIATAYELGSKQSPYTQLQDSCSMYVLESNVTLHRRHRTSVEISSWKMTIATTCGTADHLPRRTRRLAHLAATSNTQQRPL